MVRFAEMGQKYIVNRSSIINYGDASDGQSPAEKNTQKALNAAGFGKFNYKIITISGLICMNVAFSLSTVGFILPSAACDFKMTTIDKGRLSTGPLLGMACGTLIWGCIADAMGRKYSLLVSIFLHASFETLASLVPYYWAVLASKIISGFALGGQSSIVYTYIGEFQPIQYRGRAMSIMEFPAILGIAISPAVAWIIIPLRIAVNTKYYFFHSWNLFTMINSLLSWGIAFWLLTLPETPKYLAETGQEGDLMQVLFTMFEENTGKNSREYTDILHKIDIKSTHEMVNHKHNESTDRTVMKLLRMLLKQMHTLMKKPFRLRTILSCIIMYCSLSSLYTLTIWFPELFDRFSNYQNKYPDKVASVCTVSRPQNQTIDESDPSTCSNDIDPDVFKNALFVGLGSIPVGIIFPLCLNYLGYKFFLSFSMAISGAASIGLYFARTSTENLILTCIFDAFAAVSSTAIYCVAVEIFPTNLRVAVAVLSSLCGRLGAIIGNVIFSYLIDNYCLTLLSLVAAQLLFGGLLAIFLPKIETESEDDESTLEKKTDEQFDKYTLKNHT